MKGLKLLSPWEQYFAEIRALFELDPAVQVVTNDGEDKTITLTVNGLDKAEALKRLLPERKDFGNVSVEIVINAVSNPTTPDLFRQAFAGNPALSFVHTVTGYMTSPLHYVVFRNKVVQFWTDDLGDIYGNCTTLYENLAAEVFKPMAGVFFCTDLPGNEGDPTVNRPALEGRPKV